MRSSFLLAGMAAVVLTGFLAAANAQQPVARVQVGVLECRGGASVGFVVGSVTNLGCVLRIEGLAEDRYVATIRKVGLDLGITQETALAWGVYAPGRRHRRQCAGRWFGQFDRAAAAQRPGPGWAECRGRVGKPGTAAGTVIFLPRLVRVSFKY